MIYFLFLLFFSIILYHTVQRFGYLPNVIIYTILNIIKVIIAEITDYPLQVGNFLFFIIMSFVIGLIYIKVYSKVIDIVGSFLYSIIYMGIFEYIFMAILNSALNSIF